MLSGLVIDPDGLPIPGARVVVKASGQQAWSDAAGRYLLRDIGAGDVVLAAFSNDFEAVELQTTIRPSGVTEADIRFLEVRKAITTVEVVGEASEILEAIPGSVASVARDEIEISRPVDANEVLRRVPGVTLREDSGPVGMRLNIGLRGLNPDRSRKVLMMEDGIPIALAPYGEPEMYYSPPIDRMQRVEVLKGSGQIVHGPQTIGGVVNFVTPEPPATTHGSLDVEGGQRGLFHGRASVGSSTRDQKVGWLLGYLHKRGDGFRELWWDIHDTQAKLTLKPGNRQTLGFKYGFYDEKSNSTYLGLTQPQWEADPNSNAVPHDMLAVRRYSGSLTHTYTLSPNAVLSSAFYGYQTVRNWGRQDWDRENLGRDYLSIAGDPSVVGGAIYLRNSAGNRNRKFHVFGGQSGLAWLHPLGRLRGSLNAGVRYIDERAEDLRINGDSFDARIGRLRDGEFRYGQAFSSHLQERVHIGTRLIVTGGVRLEHYDYEREIFRLKYEDVDTVKNDTVPAAIPGLGLSVKAHDSVTFFAGVHRGFAPPRTKDSITSDGASLDLDAELSWNYEVGVRVNASPLLSAELAFFRLDFENQVITAAESGGATTSLVNGGESLHQGVEGSFRFNWDRLWSGSWSVYTDTRYMYLPTAKFTRNVLYAGNRLPYAPRHTFGLLVGLRQRDGFGLQLDTSYTANQFGDNEETMRPSNDGTSGLVPAFQIWNLMVDYTMRRERLRVSPYLTVKNLANQLYIGSRAPQGIQPGMLRQANAGLRITF